MAPASPDLLAVVGSFVAEAYLDIVGTLPGSVGDSPDFGNSHNFGFGVEGCNSFGLDGDYNSHVVAELCWNFSLNCCCLDST